MLKYMLGCSFETSPAQPPSANNAKIAAHARMVQVPQGFPGRLLHVNRG
jgi:hypothetical protein